MHRSSFVFVLTSCSALLAQTPQHQVVPALYDQNDAVAYEWIAGASRDLRQQTLIGAGHLRNLIGFDITAIELRRTAANEVYLGGTANLTVTLSTSPRTPLGCADVFALNVGGNAVPVFSGAVTLPTSPPALGPTVDWTPANVVRIAFAQAFHYLGGTLCIDVVGSPIASQNADWWMADAVFEDLSGSEIQIGNGCGVYGGAQGQWSNVAPRTLLPGAYGKFWAYGTPNSLGVVAFGAPSAVPIPLSAFGLPAPNCFCHLEPASIIATVVTLFVPELDPRLASRGGVAAYRLKIPNQTWTFGTQLTAQWLELAQPATSNAIRWTVASAMPTLDMALIEGHPSEARGEVSVHLAHVLRLEYQ